MIGFLIYLVNLTANVLELLIVVYAITTFFLSPYHPIRHTLARWIEPMLAPIRRALPPIGGFDLSPLVLIFLIAILRSVVVQLLVSLV